MRCTAPGLLQHPGMHNFLPLCKAPAVHSMGIQAGSLAAQDGDPGREPGSIAAAGLDTHTETENA